MKAGDIIVGSVIKLKDKPRSRAVINGYYLVIGVTNIAYELDRRPWKDNLDRGENANGINHLYYSNKVFQIIFPVTK